MNVPLIGIPKHPQIEIFTRFASAAQGEGFKNCDVAGAAATMVVKALSQDCHSRQIAEARLEEIVAFMRKCLAEKYSRMNGRILRAANDPAVMQ